MAGFNVLHQPCVRIRLRPDAPSEEITELVPGGVPGGSLEVGVRTALVAAHLAADIEVGNPAVEAMVRRLLTAMVVRIFELEIADRGLWEEQFDALLAGRRFLPGPVDGYVRDWEHRFDLYDTARPFLQDPQLAAECGDAGHPGYLVMPRPSGSGQAWFDHTPQSAPIASSEGFGWLLAWRGFGPSGMGTPRAHAGAAAVKNMYAGPLRSLLSYHPLGRSLFESLVLSCPPPPAVAEHGADLAPWEQEELEDPLAPTAAAGPVSLLVGRTAHHVLLAPDGGGEKVVGAWVAWGSRREPPAARDPFTVERPGRGPERANHRRALLRDFDAFVHARDPAQGDTGGRILPPWLSVFADLPPETLDVVGEVRVRALGCDQDRMPRERHWFAASTPESIAPYLPSRDPQRAARVSRVRTLAETAAAALGAAVGAGWRGFAPGDADRNPWRAEAEAQYWDRAEDVFWPAIAADSGPEPDFRSVALDVFDAVTAPAAACPQGLYPIAAARARLRNPRRTRSAA